jgi:SAM-dependent methyltransferase
MMGGLEGKLVVVAGCGRGIDLLTWLPYRPRAIVGVDIAYYRRCWDTVTEIAVPYGVTVKCLQYDMTKGHWDFVEDGTVDVVASHAVLEHVSNLPAFLAGARTALRDGGVFEAVYGPLWYAPNGDHLDYDHLHPADMDRIYAHLELSDIDYETYVDNRLSTTTEHETTYDGPLLLKLGLFSYLRPFEYLDSFRQAGFDVAFAQANISSLALRFAQRYPVRWENMKRKHGVTDLDLRTVGSHVYLTKRLRSRKH